MQVNGYINSGILEQYCLGLLTKSEQEAVLAMSTVYPEVKADLAEIELALERLAAINTITPKADLKQQILDIIATNGVITLDNLPPTGRYSDCRAWLKAVEHLIPTQPFEDFFAYPLRHNDKIEQTLIVSKLGVPEETHQDVIESFFILEGSCVCTVGKHTYTLNAGDFLEIPLHEEHDVILTSPHVVAILQHQLI
ncbi:MAG: cupin domain-containing protein [Mucilaginibacter sp.]|nr:cupin domain-containing protein [Mucilaginibacter sp.]